MNVEEAQGMARHVLSTLHQSGLYDIGERDLFALLAREWAPYAHSKPRYDDAALDRLVATVVEEWKMKRTNGIRGPFLTALQAGIKDYCSEGRRPVEKVVQMDLFGGSHNGSER